MMSGKPAAKMEGEMHGATRLSSPKWWAFIAGVQILGLALIGPKAVRAVPPPAAAVGTASVGNAHWVRHRVIPGERLDEIAERYAVSSKDILVWNKLNPKKAWLRAGTRLRIRTQLDVPKRDLTYHIVQPGESWSSIARHYGVSPDHLRRRWNANLKTLRIDDQVAVWVEGSQPTRNHRDRVAPSKQDKQDKQAKTSDTKGEPSSITSGDGPDVPESVDPASLSAARARSRRLQQDADPRMVSHEMLNDEGEPVNEDMEDIEDALGTDYFPIMDVPLRSRSLGHPGSGHIFQPVQLPQNESLYHLRDPERSYVSSHTAMILQNAIARFRLRSGYKGMILIKDLSRRGGGPLFPHKSHQSGRDADVQLLLKEDTTLYSAANVDWDANWALLYSLVESKRMRYIFLSWPQQRLLYRAARRAGFRPSTLEPILEYPKRGRQSIIRDEEGHDTHFHVRVDCAPWEGSCIN